MAHGRSKHIEKKYHFLHDQVNKEELQLEFWKTDLQLADILAKPLKRLRFEDM